MADYKMTIKDQFAATIAILKGEQPRFEWSTADAIHFLEGRLAQASKPKKKSTKVNQEAEAFALEVSRVMTSEPVTAKDVAAMLDVSAQKASAALRRLVKEGVAVEVGRSETGSKTYAIQ